MGVDNLSRTSTISGAREISPEFRARETDHWRRRLIEMLESRLLDRLLGTKESEERLTHLAAEVASAKKIRTPQLTKFLPRAEIKSGTYNMRLGDIEVHLLTDGTFRLDGGAMFGIVPKPLWERKSPPDDRNRILLAMNVLLIRAAGNDSGRNRSRR